MDKSAPNSVMDVPTPVDKNRRQASAGFRADRADARSPPNSLSAELTAEMNEATKDLRALRTNMQHHWDESFTAAKAKWLGTGTPREDDTSFAQWRKTLLPPTSASASTNPSMRNSTPAWVSPSLSQPSVDFSAPPGHFTSLSSALNKHSERAYCQSRTTATSGENTPAQVCADPSFPLEQTNEPERRSREDDCPPVRPPRPSWAPVDPWVTTGLRPSVSESSNRALQAEVDTLLKVNRALQAEVDRITSHDREGKVHSDMHWERQCRALQEKVQQLEQEDYQKRTLHVSKLEEEVDCLGSHLRNARLKHAEQVNKSATLEEERDFAYTEQQSLIADLQHCQTEQMEAQRMLCDKATQWEKRLKELETHKSDLERTTDEQQTLLEQERKALEEQSEALRESTLSLQADQEALAKDRMAMEEEKRTLEEELRIHEEKNEQLAEGLEREQKQRVEDRALSSRCAKEKKSLLEEIGRYRDEISLAKEAIRRSNNNRMLELAEHHEKHKIDSEKLESMNEVLQAQLQDALEHNRQLATDMGTACDFQKLTSAKAHKRSAVEVEELRQWKTNALLSMKKTQNEFDTLKAKYKRQLSQTYKLQKKMECINEGTITSDNACNGIHRDFLVTPLSSLCGTQVSRETIDREERSTSERSEPYEARGNARHGLESQLDLYESLDDRFATNGYGDENARSENRNFERGNCNLDDSRVSATRDVRRTSVQRGRDGQNGVRSIQRNRRETSSVNRDGSMVTRGKKSMLAETAMSFHSKESPRSLTSTATKTKSRAKSIPNSRRGEQPFR